ncbi:hypothetical protein [Magnetovibrio sp.]|uniref:hypothetical protein n=1 Tax=Magnetovibrio sp. TaxID=2024836 RepID=UPI002F957D94
MTEKEPLMTLRTRPAAGTVDAAAGDASHGGAHGAYGDGTYTSSDGLPLLGLFAVGFGLLSIFTIGPVFVPLALIFGLVAIFAGQILLGLTAVVLSLIGVLTSPTLMVVLGIGAFAAWLGIPLPF